MILDTGKKKTSGLEEESSMLLEFSLSIRRHFPPQKKIVQLQDLELHYRGEQANHDRNVDTIFIYL